MASPPPRRERVRGMSSCLWLCALAAAAAAGAVLCVFLQSLLAAVAAVTLLSGVLGAHLLIQNRRRAPIRGRHIPLLVGQLAIASGFMVARAVLGDAHSPANENLRVAFVAFLVASYVVQELVILFRLELAIAQLGHDTHSTSVPEGTRARSDEGNNRLKKSRTCPPPIRVPAEGGMRRDGAMRKPDSATVPMAVSSIVPAAGASTSSQVVASAPVAGNARLLLRSLGQMRGSNPELPPHPAGGDEEEEGDEEDDQLTPLAFPSPIQTRRRRSNWNDESANSPFFVGDGAAKKEEAEEEAEEEGSSRKQQSLQRVGLPSHRPRGTSLEASARLVAAAREEREEAEGEREVPGSATTHTPRVGSGESQFKAPNSSLDSFAHGEGSQAQAVEKRSSRRRTGTHTSLNGNSSNGGGGKNNVSVGSQHSRPASFRRLQSSDNPSSPNTPVLREGSDVRISRHARRENSHSRISGVSVSKTPSVLVQNYTTAAARRRTARNSSSRKLLSKTQTVGIDKGRITTADTGLKLAEFVEPWFMAHRHFLLTRWVMMFLLALTLLAYAPFLIWHLACHLTDDFHAETDSYLAIMASLAVGVTIFLVTRTHEVVDGYNLRQQAIGVSIVVVVCCVFWLVEAATAQAIPEHVPTVFMLVAFLFVTVAQPLLQVRRSRRGRVLPMLNTHGSDSMSPRSLQTLTSGNDGSDKLGLSHERLELDFLEAVILDSAARAVFRRHLAKECAIENLIFIENCEHYVQTCFEIQQLVFAGKMEAQKAQDILQDSALVVYAKCVADSTPYQVNLPADIREEIDRALEPLAEERKMKDPRWMQRAMHASPRRRASVGGFIVRRRDIYKRMSRLIRNEGQMLEGWTVPTGPLDHTVFFKAEQNIMHLLRGDNYPRFISSPEWDAFKRQRNLSIVKRELTKAFVKPRLFSDRGSREKEEEKEEKEEEEEEEDKQT